MNFRHDFRSMLRSDEAEKNQNYVGSYPEKEPVVTPNQINTKLALCLAGIAGTVLCGAAAYIANNPEAVKVITNFLNR